MAGVTKIELPLRVRGTMHLKPDVESAPAVTLYTDRYLGSNVVRLPLTAEWQDVTLCFTIGRASVDANRIRDAITRAQLNVDGIVRYRTHIGTTARKNAGEADIGLGRLFATPHTPQTLPLRMLMLSDAELRRVLPKGTVEICAADHPRINGKALVVLATSAELEAIAQAQQRESARRVAELRGLMFSWQELFDRLPQTFPSAKSINCYVQRLRNGHVVPSIAYMMQSSPPQIDVAFYENMLDIVLRRESLTREQLASVSTFDLKVCNVAAQMMCVWSNWAPYVSDECWVPKKPAADESTSTGASEKKSWLGFKSPVHKLLEMKHFAMEEFEIAEYYGSDDCEGLGFVILRLVQYLMRLDVSAVSPALQKIRDLLKHYMPVLLLCGVTTGDLGGDFAALTDPDAKMGAHMFAVFIPLGRAVRMFKRCNASDKLFHSLPLDVESAIVESAELPVLLAEGTGLLVPRPINLPRDELKRLVLQRADAHIGAGVDVSIEQLYAEPIAGDVSAPVNFIANNAGMAPFTSTTGSQNPAFSNNSLWLTNAMQEWHSRAFANGVRKFYHMTSSTRFAPHFYRTAHLGMTPYWAEQNVSLFSFAIVQRANADAPWSAGATFADLLNEGTADAEHEVGLWPEQEPDAQEYAHIVQEMRNMPPPPPLHPPAAPGVNNTWDPTAMVMTAEQMAEMQAAVIDVQRASIRATIHTMLHAMTHARGSMFAGTPHLMSSCPCAREMAKKMIAEDATLAHKVGGSIEAFIARFRDTMGGTAAGTDHRRAVVATFGLNHEQWYERSAYVRKAATTPISLKSEGAVMILPAGVHIDHEHVTAETGGFMVRLYTMIQYHAA